jgi:hypothetical protein
VTAGSSPTPFATNLPIGVPYPIDLSWSVFVHNLDVKWRDLGGIRTTFAVYAPILNVSSNANFVAEEGTEGGVILQTINVTLSEYRILIILKLTNAITTSATTANVALIPDTIVGDNETRTLTPFQVRKVFIGLVTITEMNMV